MEVLPCSQVLSFLEIAPAVANNDEYVETKIITPGGHEVGHISLTNFEVR
jgi:hypothetical protein